MARTIKIRVDASGIHKAAGAARKLGERFGAVHAKISRMTSAIFSMKTAFMGFIAIRAVSFFKSMFEALGQQQIAVRGLGTAMKASGNYTKEAHDRLLEYAKALTKTTAFSDEAIIGAMRMLATFKLNEKTMKNATIATLNMAAATGQDLQQAAILMGKAAVGVTSSLSRYGIIIDQADLKARGFAAVLDELNKEFGGQAEMIRGTVSGQMQLLSNMWGDMKENIAKTIVESGAFNEMTQIVRATITDVVEYVKANPRIFASMFEAGVAAGKALVTVTQALLPFFQYIVENKTVLMGVLGAYVGARAGAAFGPWGALIGAVGGAAGGAAWGASMEEAAPAANQQAQIDNTNRRVRNAQMGEGYFSWGGSLEAAVV